MGATDFKACGALKQLTPSLIYQIVELDWKIGIEYFALNEDVPNYWHHSAAMAYAGAGDLENALVYLRKVVEQKWPYPNYTEHCEEFAALREMPEWQSILTNMRNC